MHEAYSILPPGKINSQIECIVGYDDFVFLGNRVGHLSQYSVQVRDDGEEQKVLQLLQYDKNFSKKNIVQIEVVPESRLLFSLSGEKQLNIHDISEHSFPLVYTEPKTRGATLFALHARTTVSTTGEIAFDIRLCVVVKRKLQFYCFKKDSLEEIFKEIDLTDVPKTMCFMNDAVCLGFDSDYVIYKLDTQPPEKISLFPPSSAKSIVPYIVDVDGEVFALAKDEFTMLVDPRANVTVTEKEKVIGTGMSPQHQPGSKKDAPAPLSTMHRKTIRWSQPLKAFVWDGPYAVGLLNDSIEIRTLDNVTEPIQVIKDLPGVRYLVRTGCGMLFAASVSQLWQIKMTDIPTQIHHLNEMKNFQLSLGLIKISRDSEADKLEEVKRVKCLLAHHLFENKKFEESMVVFIELAMDPCYVIKLFPNFQAKDSSKPTLVLTDHEVENALMSLQFFLAHVRPDIRRDFDAGVTEPKWYGKTPAAMLSIMDTTMLKCYLQTKDSLVAPLLRLNHCHLEESEKLLKKYQKHRELIILYQTKGQPRMALDLLRSMDEEQNAAPQSPNANNLNGFVETIRYLQSLGSENIALICEYANWVLARDPEEGLKIFTVDMDDVEALPRGVVTDFLLKNHRALVIPYLRHIIDVWGDKKPHFHNILVQMYRDRIFDQQVRHGKGSAEEQELRKSLYQFLRESREYSPEVVLKDFPTNDFFRERTIILNHSGQHRKALQIFVQVLGDYEQAMAYCAENYKAPNHLTAPLEGGGGESGDRPQDVYFILIETLLNQPQESPFPDVPLHSNCQDRDLANEQVFAILDEHGAKISAQRVIEIMPDDIPLARLSRFIETALHHQLEQRRKTQVLKGLLYADHLAIHEQRIRCESKHVLITDSSCCHICKKKFNNASAFVRYPTGEVVHFACQQMYKL